MCGLVGIVKTSGLVVDNKLEVNMNLAANYLEPRGPDGSGFFKDNFSYFIHKRLSIIDISNASSQPIKKANFVLCFNGEIYNYREIREELVSLGYKFNSDGDGEVLLTGWIEWGENILQRLDGMFAFSIWDKKNKSLYLCRDRFGKKPLVYSLKNNSIAFSSDLRSLSKVIDCGKIKQQAIKSLFRFRFIHEPLTIFEDAYKLQAGEIGIFNSTGFKKRKWYRLENNIKPIIKNKEKIESSIRSLFHNSIDKRLVSDVPMGVFLSGGIDSGIILSALAEKEKKLPCFTIGFDDASKYYEERPNAEKIAKYYGMPHSIINLSQKNILNHIPNILSSLDEPFADSSVIPTYMVSLEVGKHIKAAFSGDGGDEVFGGYRKYLGQRWQSIGNFIPNKLRNKISNCLSDNKDSMFGEYSRRLKRFLSSLSDSNLEMHINLIDQLESNEHQALFGKKDNTISNTLSKINNQYIDKINANLAMDIGFSLPGDMLVKVDRMSMANSIEVRSPFLDKNLVEYSFSIPGNLKVGYLGGKKILKDAFARDLPSWYLKLPKKGFEVPLSQWLKGDLRYLVEESTSSNILELMGIRDNSIIDNWKNDFYNGDKDNAWKLWTLVTFSNWAKSIGYC